MAVSAFRTIRKNAATSFNNNDLLFVHCVAKEDFVIFVVGIECVELVCRQIHVSFVDKMNQRRVALLPSVLESQFETKSSPVLVRIIASSDLKFYDHADDREEYMVATILWELEIIPSPSPARVDPVKPIHESNLDKKLPPLDLDCTLNCNCFSFTPSCLCDFVSRVAVSDQEPDSLADLLLDNDDFNTALNLSEEDHAVTTPQPTTSSLPASSEQFRIKGSVWEERYQRAFQVVADKRANNMEISFKIVPEPDNVQDKNALSFAVLDGTQYRVLGYCGVEKLPKLMRALHHKEITDIKLCSLRRRWIPMEMAFKYEGILDIIKKGPWDKNDSRNRYNSDISLY